MTRPSLPLRYSDNASCSNQLDLTDLSTTLSESAAKREEAYTQSRQMKTALIPIRDQIGTEKAKIELQHFLSTYQEYIVPTTTTATDQQQQPQALRSIVREANLSERVAEAVQLAAYQHFLETGTLLPPVDWATDEEYLSGALMGLAQDLQRYGLGRATVRDATSVQAAGDLVSAVLDFLLELDFRNGPLRRKYDGTKYSLKALETLLYELAVTTSSSSSSSSGTTTAEPESKRSKPEGDAASSKQQQQLLPHEALQAIKVRMEHRDELRERLIKKCRDGQKAAKQSIYALHRGDRAKAEQLLQQCKTSIQEQLLPIVQEEPPLRAGSFANVVEEYVEAKLFAVWLHGDSPMEQDSNDSSSSSSNKPSCVFLTPQDFAKDLMPLEPDEYVGGLCDLTGEIGRYAVKCGTERDVESVKLCLQANSNIAKAIEMMERTPGYNKKVGAVWQSINKLERMLYEMSLSAAAGGRHVESHVNDMEDDA